MSDKEYEIQNKYKILALQYSNVKAQVEVLKNALKEEQKRTQSQQNYIKNCEQQIRKCNQEIESLTFRNQQLVKRISLLQSDLSIPKPHSYTANNSSDHWAENLIDQKLLENAEMSTLIAEQQAQIAQYQKRLESLERNVEKERKTRLDLEKKHRDDLKIALENSHEVIHRRQLEQLQIENEELNSKANSFWNEILALEVRLGTDLSKAVTDHLHL